MHLITRAYYYMCNKTMRNPFSEMFSFNSPREDEPSSQRHYSKRVTGNKNKAISKVSSVTYLDFLQVKTIRYVAFVKKILKKIT